MLACLGVAKHMLSHIWMLEDIQDSVLSFYHVGFQD